MTALRNKLILSLVLVAGVLLAADYLDEDEWPGNADVRPLRGDERRAVITVSWAPSGTDGEGVMKIRSSLIGGIWDAHDSPAREHQYTSIGARIEVDATKVGTRPDFIDITVLIQTAKGDYPLRMLCTEPTRSRKVCVGTVT